MFKLAFTCSTWFNLLGRFLVCFHTIKCIISLKKHEISWSLLGETLYDYNAASIAPIKTEKRSLLVPQELNLFKQRKKFK